MPQKESIKGFEGYRKCVEDLYKDKNTQLYIYFTGEKNEEGVSWCPDCNEAEPIVKEAIEKYGKKDAIFLTVDVGDRVFWKDMKNPFREDSDIKLMVIPTLIRWKSVMRLEGGHLTNMDLLEMFLSDEQ